jgi:hypothetical protein
LDAVFLGKVWSCDLAEVGGIGISPPDGKPFSGGLRTRLRVEDKNGTVDRFCVNHLDEVVEHLRTLVSHRTEGHGPVAVDEPRPRARAPWIVTGLLLTSGAALILVGIFVLRH